MQMNEVWFPTEDPQNNVSGQRDSTFPTLKPIYNQEYFQRQNKLFNIRSGKISVNLRDKKISPHVMLCF